MILTRLREHRERVGKTQAEIAAAVECSVRTIHNYENGGKILARVADKVAAALNVKLKELL